MHMKEAIGLCSVSELERLGKPTNWNPSDKRTQNAELSKIPIVTIKTYHNTTSIYSIVFFTRQITIMYIIKKGMLYRIFTCDIYNHLLWNIRIIDN